MIAGQINLLKERADAVAQLVRSLKAENASLKQSLLSAQAQTASLLNEISRLKTENQILFEKNGHTASDKSTKDPTVPSSFRREQQPPVRTESDTAISDSTNRKPEPPFISDFSEETPSAAPRSEPDYSAIAFFRNTDSVEGELSEPEPQDDSPADNGLEFDPFFDAFSRYEPEPDDSTVSYDSETETGNEYDSPQEPPRTEFRSPAGREPEPAKPVPYSQLDIFY